MPAPLTTSSAVRAQRPFQLEIRAPYGKSRNRKTTQALKITLNIRWGMVNSISFASWNALAVFYERWRKTEKTRTISKRMMFHLCCTTKTGVHCVLHTEISCLVVDCTLFTLCAVATVCAWIPTHTHTRTHTHSHTHTHTPQPPASGGSCEHHHGDAK